MGSSCTMTITQLNSSIPLGLPVPPHTPHAISVSLPTWGETLAYKQGMKHIHDALLNGYPRMFIQLNVRKLAALLEQRYGVEGERSMLFPTYEVAKQCQQFMEARDVAKSRIIGLLVYSEGKKKSRVIECKELGYQHESTPASTSLYILLFPADSFSIANQFWQHSGQGISSRLTDYCLSALSEDISHPNGHNNGHTNGHANGHTNGHTNGHANGHTNGHSNGHINGHVNDHANGHANGHTNGHVNGHVNGHTNGHVNDYANGHANGISSSPILSHTNASIKGQCSSSLLPDAAVAKRVLRQRITDLLIRYGSDDLQRELYGAKTNGSQASCSVTKITEDDVFLYPTGMSAIWNVHQLALAVRPSGKSVCFGFVYCDTLKILEKWGPGCYFYPGGIDSEIDDLEIVLEREFVRDPTKPPILALYTEFPSNPLLNSPHLPRLRALADKYDFLLVIDDTIGNFVNVEVLPYADILVSSLSKIFSGNANVMGGSVVFNPNRRYYATLKAYMDTNYRDTYYHEDAIHMEFNSRDFEGRIRTIDENAEALCDFLRPHTIAAGNKKAVIKEVFYPKYITPENYERCRTRLTDHKVSSSSPNGDDGYGGYGGLFSLTFTSGAASAAFYDALGCFKGPSLGTNFTLACTYTLLAHYKELDWAAQFGVEPGLVRLSVGTEDKQALLKTIEVALNAAEAAGATCQEGEETNGL